MFQTFYNFLCQSVRVSLRGSRTYHAWLSFLAVICLIGLRCFTKQTAEGLIVTGMTDHVSWGLYIANFTFIVGLAAAAVMLVIPAYIYKNKHLHEVVILGELLAIAAIIMCIMFVTVDLGRCDRFWHLTPVVGVFNFPVSMLSWDILVLAGYFLLNVYICGYLLYMKYL